MRDSRSSTIVLLLLAAICAPASLSAQSRTSSALRGTVSRTDGTPIVGATVQIRHQETGAQRTTGTNERGAFLVLLLQPGGPYTVTVNNIGFAEEQRANIALQVGEVTTINLVLSEQAIELPGIDVSVDRAEIFNPTLVGPATLLNERAVESIPLMSRDIMELAVLSPLVKVTDSGGFSVAGQNDRYNAILVDGILNKDMFGLTAGGVPGGQAGAKLIPLDAVSQYEVLIAPFDVRLSGFTGGVMNAVTRSGTNDWRIRGAAVFRTESLMGDLTLPTGPVAASGIDRSLAAFSVGGPIVYDQGHFFVTGEFEQRHQPPDGFNLFRDDPSLVRISTESLSAFQDEFETLYGADTGTGEIYPLEQELINLFGRIDWNFENGDRFTIRNVLAHASNDQSPNRSAFQPYELSSNAVFRSSFSNTTSFQLFSELGGWGANQLDLSVQRITDRTTPASDIPQIEVELISSVDGVSFRRPVRVGGNFFAQENDLAQTSYRLTNSLDLYRGEGITTLGVTASYYDIKHTFLPGAGGEYYFVSSADIATGAAQRFQRTVLADGVDPEVGFGVLEWGGFVQHQLNAGDGLSMRFGLRFDVPHVIGSPGTNYDVLDYFGYDTGSMPSGNIIISPRWGFNWQSEDENRWQVRVGVGMFAGQLPYVWLANAFHQDGVRSVIQSCQGRHTEEPPTGNTVPPFEVGSLPESCLLGPFTEYSNAVLFPDDFKYPRDMKFAVTADRELSSRISATVGVLFSKALNQIALEEINIEQGSPEGGEEQLGGFERRFYKPVNPAYGSVLTVTNDGEDWAVAGSAELRGRVGEDLNFQLGYAFSRSWDRMSLMFSDMQSNFGLNPIEGDVNRPGLTRSSFDRPHKIVVAAFGRPFSFLPDTEISLLYTGQSGLPFSYVYDMDVNGDGYPGLGGAFDRYNDLLWVPDNAFDYPASLVTQQLLDAAIRGDACIANFVGEIVDRNGCRSPWQNRLDLRLTHTLRVGNADVRLEGDLINVLNLANPEWGKIESIRSVVSILEECVDCGPALVTWGGAVLPQRDEDGRFQTSDPWTVLSPDSQWQMQFGARITFGDRR